MTFDDKNTITLSLNQIENIKIVNNDDNDLSTNSFDIALINDFLTSLVRTVDPVVFNDDPPALVVEDTSSSVAVQADELDTGGEHENGFTIDISDWAAAGADGIDSLEKLQLFKPFSLTKDGQNLVFNFGVGLPTLTIEDAYETIAGNDEIKSSIDTGKTIIFRYGSGDADTFTWQTDNILFDSTIDSGTDEKTYTFEANQYYAVLDTTSATRAGDDIADLSTALNALQETRFYVHPDTDSDVLIAEARGRNAFDTSPPTRDTAAGNFKIVLKDFEVIKGSAGRDVLLGNDEANIFQGGAGRDWIEGAGGDDTLDGGTGADTYLYRYTTSDQDGIDTITDSDGSNTIRIVVDDFTKPWRDMIEVQRTVSEVKLFMKDSMGNKDEDNVIILQSADVDALNFKLEFTPTADATDAADIRGVSARSLHIESTPGAGEVLMGTAGDDDTFVVVPGTTTDVTGNSGEDDTISFQEFLTTDQVTLDLSSGADATVTSAGVITQSIAVSNVRHIIGSAGDDTLTGDAQANTLRGSGGGDILDGKEGIDTLEGGAGADTLTGGEGNDILQGGAGADTYIFAGDSGTDTITEVSEMGIENILRFQDLVTNVDWQQHFNFALVSDVLTITFDDNSGHRSVVEINQFSSFNAGDFKFEYGTTSGNVLSVILGTTGGDTAINGDAEDDYLVGFGGTDTLTGGAGDDTLDGGAGTDTLTGGAGDDTLDGGAGTDTLTGGEGDDTLVGGAGADTYVFSGTSDTDTITEVSEMGIANILRFEGWDLGMDSAWQEYFSFAFDNVADELTITFNDRTSSSTVVIENYYSAGDFEFHYDGVGNSGPIPISIGMIGNDDDLMGSTEATGIYRFGSDGDDTFVGTSGTDTFDGGAGSDTVSYATSTTALQINLAIRDAKGAVKPTGGLAEGDRLIGIENIIGGSGDDRLTGDGEANTLTGGKGINTLTGGAGADTYVYYVTTSDDGIDTIEDGEGINTIIFHVTDTNLDAIDTIDFTGLLFGSQLDDIVTSLVNSVSRTVDTLDFHFNSNIAKDIVHIRLEDIKEGKIALEFVNTMDGIGGSKGEISATKLQRIFFPKQEFNYDAAAVETSRTGPGDVTINLESLAIDFSGDTDLKNLLRSGLFSYEQSEGDTILTFGNGSTAFPKKTLRLSDPPPDSITFVDSGDNKLVFSPDSGKVFLTELNTHTVRAGSQVTGTSTYLVAGTFSGTDDTANLSGLSDKIVLDLTIGTAAIGTSGDVIAVGNIENIIGGGGDDILTGDAGDNKLTGGDGADTYVYHYTDIGGADERTDGKVTITSEADGGNTIRIVVDGSPAPVFQKHFDSSDTEIAGKVRLSFDDTNYIVLDRADLDDDITAVGGNSKFQLEIMGTTMNFVDTNTAYEDFVDKSTPQDYTYSKDVADNVDLIGLGPVTIDISSLGSPGINFSGTTSDAKLKALMTRGLFSYEVDTDGNTVLAFGDGSTGFPIKKVTLNSSPPDITFVGVIVDGTSTELKFLASAVPNFLTSLNDHTLNTHTDNNYEVTNANIADTYLIKGSSAGTDDTADLSGVNDGFYLTINLESRLGNWIDFSGLGSSNFAVVDIENIKVNDNTAFGSLVTGDANDNTFTGGLGSDRFTGGAGADTLIGGKGIDSLTGGAGADRLEGGLGGTSTDSEQLMGGMGADTYVYHYKRGTRSDGADIITEVDEEKVNIIELYFGDGLTVEWGKGKLVYFEADGTNNVRLVFQGDSANYIVLSRDLLEKGRFALKAYDTNDNLITTGDFPVDAAGLITEYTDFVDRDTPQSYTYPATDESLTKLGDVTIDVSSLGSLGITFAGNLEALLASGLFSYEQGVDNIVLTLGDGSSAYPLRDVTLKISPPDIKFVGASSTELNFPASGTSFIDTLNVRTIRTPDADNKYKVTDLNKADD